MYILGVQIPLYYFTINIIAFVVSIFAIIIAKKKIKAKDKFKEFITYTAIINLFLFIFTTLSIQNLYLNKNKNLSNYSVIKTVLNAKPDNGINDSYKKLIVSSSIKNDVIDSENYTSRNYKWIKQGNKKKLVVNNDGTDINYFEDKTDLQETIINYNISGKSKTPIVNVDSKEYKTIFTKHDNPSNNLKRLMDYENRNKTYRVVTITFSN